ncbi:cobalamin-binding protein [Methanoculleus palmolei]|jgi:iron complex transport system substrate-binding protein|uniref:Cobalamin-binding protein n=1 Tax=Methanoculleus palmolei TaxID=72612 RepID=A0ABD8A6W9_9EURY|nr:cobalamin-binding protein [Methanoculleus palmolei]
MRNMLLMVSVSLVIALFLSVGAAGATLAPDGDTTPIVPPPEESGNLSSGGLTPAATETAGRVVTVTDDSGETVVIRGIPQRIVSLAPSNTEILYALGLGDRIVGVADYSNYPPEASDKPTVGGYSSVNLERVVAAEPDLVVAALGNTEEVIDRLRGLGMTVLYLDPQTIDDVLKDIELVGAATGQEEQASALALDLQNRTRAVTDKTGDLAEKPSVAHVVWHDPIWVSGRGTFQDEVITMAGGTNAFGSVDEWSIVGLEEFIATDPEYIIVSSGTGMTEEEQNVIYNYFINESRMQNLEAVRNNHVYVIDADIISRGGPRIVDALEEVAGDIHPDLFEAPARTTTPAARAPGFGAVPLVCALCIVALFGTKR